MNFQLQGYICKYYKNKCVSHVFRAQKHVALQCTIHIIYLSNEMGLSQGFYPRLGSTTGDHVFTGVCLLIPPSHSSSTGVSQ